MKTLPRTKHEVEAAARSGTKKFDRGLSQLMHVDLHWLDVPERVKYKLATMVYNCLHGKAPSYLTDCCIPISDVASRRHVLPVVVNYSSLDTIELREPLITANSFSVYRVGHKKNRPPTCQLIMSSKSNVHLK